MKQKFKNLDEIKNAILKCKKCPLYENIHNYVPGEGSANSKIFFIGEGPGKEEDLQGKPFVGRSGKILRQLIKDANLKEKDIFISNVVKCRPPNNRDPLPNEIKACWNYLEAQFNIIKPKLICTLGRHSMNRFLHGKKISIDHGKVFQNKEGQYFLPLFHPAVACYSPSKLKTLQEDFSKINEIIKMIEEKKK